MGWNRDRMAQVARSDEGFERDLLEEIGFPARRDARVLDVGCFDGTSTVSRFSPYGNVAHVVGIDPLREEIELARAAAPDERFSFHCSDLEHFDAQGEAFDLVYFSHVLQHVGDPQAALSKAASLLAPGGWVVVKTVDDGAKLSHPDPDRVMERLMELYAKEVRPRVAHTRVTDRFQGRACYGYFLEAGLSEVRMWTPSASTVGMDASARRELFERCVYFRRKAPQGMAPEDAAELAHLVRAWGDLFERDDYFFQTTTFVFAGRAPFASDEVLLRALDVRDVPAVMEIELSRFPDPWSAVSYRADLEDNPRAWYRAACTPEGRVVGYAGMWDMHEQGYASLVKIAVDPAWGRAGVGRMLVESLCAHARRCGCTQMQLEVRAENAVARSFYRSVGFEEAAVYAGYYTAPDDDAVALVRLLS